MNALNDTPHQLPEYEYDYPGDDLIDIIESDEEESPLAAYLVHSIERPLTSMEEAFFAATRR